LKEGKKAFQPKKSIRNVQNLVQRGGPRKKIKAALKPMSGRFPVPQGMAACEPGALHPATKKPQAALPTIFLKKRSPPQEGKKRSSKKTGKKAGGSGVLITSSFAKEISPQSKGKKKRRQWEGGEGGKSPAVGNIPCEIVWGMEKGPDESLSSKKIWDR